MKQLIVKAPPNPDDARYAGNMIGWTRDMYQWAMDTKGKLEQTSKINFSPLDQAFQIGTHALSTSLTGTSTGTSVTNFVCSLVAAMQKRGMVSNTGS